MSAEEERRALFLFRKVPRPVSVPGVVFSRAFHLVVNCLSASLLPHRCDPASGGCSKSFEHCLVGRRGGRRRTCRNSYRPRSMQRTLLTEGSSMCECSSVDAVNVKRLLVLTAGVVQHFQYIGAPGHVIIVSGTTINCVNRYEGDQVKKDEMGWACGMKGVKKNAYRISVVET